MGVARGSSRYITSASRSLSGAYRIIFTFIFPDIIVSSYLKDFRFRSVLTGSLCLYTVMRVRNKINLYSRRSLNC